MAQAETDLASKVKELTDARNHLANNSELLKKMNQECMELRMNTQKWEASERSFLERRRSDQEKIVSLQQQLSEKMDEYQTLHSANQEMEIELYQAKRQVEGAEKTIDIYKKEMGIFKDLRSDYEARIQQLSDTVSQLAYI